MNEGETLLEFLAVAGYAGCDRLVRDTHQVRVGKLTWDGFEITSRQVVGFDDGGDSARR